MSSHAATHAECQRRELRPWRAIFVLYIIALTTGTHWPQLHLTIGPEPAPSRVIHALAFGGLTFLLWRTKWLGEGWRLLSALLAWSALDELAQGLPGLGRTVTWTDLAANWSGVILVFAWIRALQPTGGLLNRMQRRATERVIDESFTRWRTWLLAISAGALMAAAVGTAATWIMWTVHPDSTLYAAFISIPAGGIGGAILALDTLWRRERERALRQQRCFFCSKPCSNAAVDRDGLGSCPECRAPIHIGQWCLRADLSRGTLIRLAWRPAVLSVALAVLVASMYVVAVALYMRFPQELLPFRRFDRLPMDVRLVIDMAVLGIIAAVAVYRFRLRLARVIDHQAARCRRCHHDVHATAADLGVGRCPECGTPFLRLPPSAARILAAAYD